MTKNEQIRLTNWRFKVLRQAADARSVARTWPVSLFTTATQAGAELVGIPPYKP
jgi:hypothetical protein